MSTNTNVRRTFRAGQRSGDAGRRRRSDQDDFSSSSPSEPEIEDDMYHSSLAGSGGVAWAHRRARGGGMPNYDHKTQLRHSQVNNHQVPYYEFHPSPAPQFMPQLNKTYAEASTSTDLPNVDWLAEVVLDAHPCDQRQFLSALLHRLAAAEVFFVKQCAEEAEKRDFIGMLPPELVSKILDLLDIRTHAVIAQVCRCWNVAVGAIWKSACLRVGLNILSDDVDHYVRLVRQIRWRLRRWTLEPATCLAESPPVPQTIDPATLTFFEPLNSREHGYLAGVVGPGLLFQPAVDKGGATYFLRTDSTEPPTSLLAMDAASVLVGFEDGVVQRWDWRRNELLAMLPPHSSMSPVTALAHAPEWDLIATGSANSSISIYRASACELLHANIEIGISAGCSVVSLRFLSRAVEAEDGSTVFRLFLGAMYLVQAMPFLNGTRMRSFANLSVFELCPMSGVILGQVFNRHSSVEDQNGVKTSLMIDEVGGCFSFLTVDYGTQQTGFDTTDNRTIYLHEYDPMMNQESIGTAIFISPSDVPPMSNPPGSDRSASPSALTHFEHLISPQNQVLGLRDWQLLGIGARYACVYVGELNHTGYLMKPGSGIAVFERPRPHSSYWKQVLAVEAPVESSVLSAAVMGERSWLDNFDGENDKGLIFAAVWFDFAHDSWQMTTYHWTKKQ